VPHTRDTLASRPSEDDEEEEEEAEPLILDGEAAASEEEEQPSTPPAPEEEEEDDDDDDDDNDDGSIKEPVVGRVGEEAAPPGVGEGFSALRAEPLQMPRAALPRARLTRGAAESSGAAHSLA
jgi:hypothetical protein